METCPYCGGECEISRGIYVDKETDTIFIDGKMLRLTKRERELFSAVYSTIPRPARYSFLMDYIYGMEAEDDEPNENILKVLLVRIRKKLKHTRFEIETVWGIGYRLREKDGKDISEWKTGETNFPSVRHNVPS